MMMKARTVLAARSSAFLLFVTLEVFFTMLAMFSLCLLGRPGGWGRRTWRTGEVCSTMKRSLSMPV